RELSCLGQTAVRVRDLQPARRAQPRGARARGHGIPAAHRRGDPLRWELLPDLPSVRDASAGGGVLPTIPSVSSRQATLRSGRAIPERLVPPLQTHVWRAAVGRKEACPGIAARYETHSSRPSPFFSVSSRPAAIRCGGTPRGGGGLPELDYVHGQGRPGGGQPPI